ncbi:hypothetical protein KIH74_11020 [Kineosporia sp. J2-2]|uniref:Uncharacterized protein n=1 Tax=Kineosporia corallincola TaxID=2835133 RepID=A0ABS5TGE6_9ACTN|nr:hypothetical protein [Kineosporia corallincola]MBT0769454.1 hypothetical protein [Kineosporia corallincola]
MDDATPTILAPVSQENPPSDVSLSAGRLLTVATGSVSVSGTHVLRRSAADVYTVRHGPLPAIRLGGLPPGKHHIKQSGPYSLVGSAVFVAAPKNRARVVLDTGAADTDIFGPHVVWRTQAGEVRQRYLDPGDTGRQVLARQDAAGPVAVWGPWSAWLDTSGSIHVLGNLGYERRIVRAGRRATDLRLNNDTLSWSARDGYVHVIDLAEPESGQHRSTLRPPYAIDGRRIVGIDAHGRMRSRTLAFDAGARPPWVISQQTTEKLEVGQPWKPRFDVTKPVKAAKLVIYGSGSPVRTLTSPGRLGTLGGFRWDGTDDSGEPVTPSCYTWLLTATAVDGSGALTGELGPNIGGSLNIDPVGGRPDGTGFGCWSDFG